MPSSPVRSLVAVLGATVIVRGLGQALELGLVMATSSPETREAYFEARNRLPILVGVVVTHGLGAILAGYIGGKIAQTAEVAHAGFAGALQVVFALLEYTTGGNPGMYPVWVRIAIPLVTVPAMLAGATVRARARTLQETT